MFGVVGARGREQHGPVKRPAAEDSMLASDVAEQAAFLDLCRALPSWRVCALVSKRSRFVCEGLLARKAGLLSWTFWDAPADKFGGPAAVPKLLAGPQGLCPQRPRQPPPATRKSKRMPEKS